MLKLVKASKRFGPQVILEEADLVVHPGEKVGLIGANGVGKTTLFRLITGQEAFDEGGANLEGRRRIGLLEQELAPSGSAILQETLAGLPELITCRQERDRIQADLEADPDSAHQQALVERMGALDHRLEELDSHSAEARAGAILQGLGFSSAELSRPLDSFSGGWRMRVALARLLFASPELMLLDEPTNHLDLESVAWLEGRLRRLDGALIIISHDRAFLDRVAGVVVEMEAGALTRFKGNFSSYLTQKEALIAQLDKAAAKQERRIQELTRFIERFRAKATKARQAQSRIKALARLEPVERRSQAAKGPRFRLPEPTPCAREMLSARNVDKSFQQQQVLKGLRLDLTRGEKVALLGPNGCGKSTLLKAVAGQTPIDGGEILPGDRVRIAYFAQHSADALDPNRTILETATAAAPAGGGMTETEIRSLLGGFLFSGEKVFDLVRVLSGGEKARLALACLFLSGANLLLLDEPTNHLDMNARAMLEETLEAYEGSLILVSHDRDMLEAACNRYLVVEAGRVRELAGGLDDYLEQCAQARQSTPEGERSAEGLRAREKAAKRQAAEVRNRLHQQTRPLRRESETLENKIHRIEETLETVRAELADNELYEESAKPRLMALLEKEGALNRDLEALMENWESVSLHIQELEEEARLALETPEASA